MRCKRASENRRKVSKEWLDEWNKGPKERQMCFEKFLRHGEDLVAAELELKREHRGV